MSWGKIKLHSTPVRRLASHVTSVAVICQELTTGLRLLARNSVRDAWWTSGVGKSSCASTSIVHYYDPSGRNMALGSTWPLSEIVPEYILGGKGGWCVGLTNLTLLKYGLSGNQWGWTSWNLYGLFRSVRGLFYCYDAPGVLLYESQMGDARGTNKSCYRKNLIVIT